jgi:peroxiredoxin
MMGILWRLAMHRLAICILSLTCAPVSADDPRPSVSVALVGLKMDLEKELTALRTATGKSNEAPNRQQWREYYERIAPICEKALELAEENPSDSASYDALTWIVTGPFGYTTKCGPLVDRAFETLIDRHISDSRNGFICKNASRFGLSSPKPVRFLRATVDRNPSRAIRGAACLKLGDLLVEHARLAKELRSQKPNSADVDALGAELRAELLDSAPEEFEKQAERAYERVISEFGETKAYPEQTLGEIARGRLFRMKELVLGKPAPSLEGTDLNEKTVKLGDYRGKAVVLVFWAGWWPPSLAAATQVQDLVQRYDKKRLELIGINGDDTRLRTERMAEQARFTSTYICDGKSGRGPIATGWGITTWPTIYVIDAEGIIRHVGNDPAKLNEIIDGLVTKAK